MLPLTPFAPVFPPASVFPEITGFSAKTPLHTQKKLCRRIQKTGTLFPVRPGKNNEAGGRKIRPPTGF
ncbi:hypothetical protein HMPREF1631_01610 [Arcanobacterium sp. S3PF19]|nr:hypothetical protein HMPREF1631_01610 [Arcanobacterium sp. S3PF19]